MLEEKDWEAIQARCDERYKLLRDCVNDMSSVKDLSHAMDLRMARFEVNQERNNRLTWLVVAGIVALVINVYLGG